MYRRTEFTEDRPEVLHEAIRQIQFASLVTTTASNLTASHVPMVLKLENDCTFLECHIARANPHWKIIETGIPALAIFLGPHCYVSPSWYETKKEDQKVVPTWNYVSVQAKGSLSIEDDPRWLMRHLHDLTDQNEMSRQKPWSVSDAPAEFVSQLSRGVVGLRLKVETIQGVWKLSQNRPQGDQLGVIQGLKESPGTAEKDVWELMTKYRTEH